MTKFFTLIKENPKEFIETLREMVGNTFLANSHWENFDGDNFLSYFEKSDDGSIEDDEIYFKFEDDAEGETYMIIKMKIENPNGLLRFKEYVFPYKLIYNWND